MGNQNSSDRNGSSSCTLCVPRRLNKSLKSLSETRNNSTSNDDFIVQYSKNNKMNDNLVGINLLDSRRLVFVSLEGCFKTWNRVPSILLYSALMIMPLKQEWIQDPSKYIHELQQHICVPCGCSDISQITDFITMIRWKTSQDLVLFALNDLDPDGVTAKIHKFAPNPLVTAFWYRVSAKLTSLHDHIEGPNMFYKPLSFEEEYWANKKMFYSKYKTTTKAILRELYFITMQANAMQEILYQSNPKSLHPVVEYKHKYSLNVGSNAKNTTNEMNLVSPLSPVMEDNETRFAFNCVSPQDHVRINIIGITPEDVCSPPDYVEAIKA